MIKGNDKMYKEYDVTYRKRKETDSETSSIIVTAINGSTAKRLAKGRIPDDCVIMKVKVRR